MARPKKKQIILDSNESLTALLQEAYNELVEQRNKAIFAYNKLFREGEEVTDIALIGKTTSEYLKIVGESIEKKLSIAKLLKDIIYKEGASAQANKQSKSSLSDEEKKMLHDLIKDTEDKTGVKYIIENPPKDEEKKD